jgi:lipopolysaccharide export system permease protein
MKKQTIGAWSYKKDPRDFKRIIRAKSGKIVHSAKKSKLQLELENGVIIQELNPSKMDKSKLPFMRYYFDSATLHFNLNSFDFERSNEDAYQKEQYLLSLNQIIILNDSVQKEIFLRKQSLDTYVKNSFSPFRLKDSISINSTPIINDSSHFFLTNKTDQQRKNEIKKAIRRTDQIINHINIEVQKKKATENYITDMSIEWNRKFTLSYAVLMLFFLGAPLGAIVKKGGLGWPVLIAILFFLLYFILTRSGEEMAENGSLDPITGMWLSAFVVTPITLFIFYKSNQDSRLFDFEFYLKFFNSIFAKKKNK